MDRDNATDVHYADLCRPISTDSMHSLCSVHCVLWQLVLPMQYSTKGRSHPFNMIMILKPGLIKAKIGYSYFQNTLSNV